LWRARRPGRVLLVDRQPALQARRRDTEVLGDLGHRGIGLPVDPDHVLAKLLGERLRHDAHPSSADTHRRRSDITYPCSSPFGRSTRLTTRGHSQLDVIVNRVGPAAPTPRSAISVNVATCEAITAE